MTTKYYIYKKYIFKNLSRANNFKQNKWQDENALTKNKKKKKEWKNDVGPHFWTTGNDRVNNNLLD